MDKSKTFQDLIVWQKAHQMVIETYKFSKTFPKEELYGITSQLRRSSVSVPANIVEGFRKKGVLDKLRFLNISQGSLEESRYYLILAKDLGFGENQILLKLVEETGKLLDAYMKAIQNNH